MNEEEKKKIQQILISKEWFSSETLDGIFANYNPKHSESLLDWFQKKFLSSSQAEELLNVLEKTTNEDFFDEVSVDYRPKAAPGQVLLSNLEIPKNIPKPLKPLPSELVETQDFSRSKLSESTINMTPSGSIPNSNMETRIHPPSSVHSSSQQALDLEIPGMVGNYQIMEKIGQGGAGKVFKARHTFLDRIVALKVLHNRILQDDKSIARFFRESKASGVLNHPKIIQSLDAGVIDGIYYLVMEYVEGETIADIIKKRKFEEKEALNIALDVLSGLQHAEEHEMIHRDLKPENIMISNKGETKILDLGLAKAIGDKTLTMQGAILGTPFYMSPEQCQGEVNLTPATDIYSLGATLYHMLTQSVPFDGVSPLVVLNQHISKPTPLLREKLSDVNPKIELLVERMMAKTLDIRFKNSKEVMEAIEKCLAVKEPATVLSLEEKLEPSSFSPLLSPIESSSEITFEKVLARTSDEKPLLDQTHIKKFIIKQTDKKKGQEGKPSKPSNPLKPSKPSKPGSSTEVPTIQPEEVKKLPTPSGPPATASVQIDSGAALEEYLKLHSTKSVDFFLQKLSDPDKDIRRVARENLPKNENPQVFLKILAMIEDENSFLERELTEQKELLNSLAFSGQKEAVPVLKRLLEKKMGFFRREGHNKYLDLKKCAIRALTQIKDSSALNILKETEQAKNQELSILAKIAISDREKIIAGEK